jgi:hypothetical protein
VNFYNFALTEIGTVESPVLQGRFGTEWPGGLCDLYLRIFFGSNNDSCYTSPAFTLATSDELQEIVLNYSDWTCGPADVDPPPCHPSVAEIYFDMSDHMPQEECLLQTCPGGGTGLLVFGGANPYRPPIIQIESGCQSGCEPANEFSFNPGLWYRFHVIETWAVMLAGEDVGCLSVRLIAEIPSAQLDTFFAVPARDEVQLVWRTVREVTLSMFELWRPIPPGTSEHPIADIPAENDSAGAAYSFLDTAAFSHGGYIAYILVMVDTSGARYGAAYVEVHQLSVPNDGEPVLPRQFALAQNYPNPFNPTTTIRYDMPQSGQIRLMIFNLLGQEVARLVDGRQVAGSHTVFWDATDFPSGIYLCRMEAAGFTQTRKLVMVK